MERKVKFFRDYIKEQAEDQTQGTAAPDSQEKESTEVEANRSEDKEVAPSGPLKGYKAEQLVDRINKLMEIMPDDIKFGVPADNYGHATTYRDANGAIEKIMDLNHYYGGKGEEVKFYCWNINYGGSWEASKNLRKKIADFGGLGKDQNINLKKVIEYFTQNPEDVDNVRSFSISLDSKASRKFADKMKNQGEENYTGEQQ